MALGICLGDIVVILAICGGIGFWLKANPEIFDFARYAGFGFLIWIAINTWRTSAVSVENPIMTGQLLPLVASGLALCLSSPQTLIMYLVLLPSVADVTMIGLNEIMLVILATMIALLGVFLVVILLAGGAQRLLRSPRLAAMWGRTMSGVIALSAVWVLLV